MTDRDAQGRPLFHPALLALAAHYGFTPEACRPHRAQTKGKIERPIGYIREDFWLGRTFRDLPDLIAQWEAWLATVANVRVHGTTGLPPSERLRAEALVRLPPHAHDPVLAIERQLSRDGFVSVRGNRYAVPLATYRSPGEVRVHPLSCELYSAGTWLATNALARGRGESCLQPLALAPTARWPAVPRAVLRAQAVAAVPVPGLPVLPPTQAWLTHDVERRDFLEVMDDRQGTRSTLLAGQLPVSHWHECIGDSTIADAICDGLVHNAHHITLTGGSMWKTRAGLTSPAPCDK